jgi:hypothetical protein
VPALSLIARTKLRAFLRVVKPDHIQYRGPEGTLKSKKKIDEKSLHSLILDKETLLSKKDRESLWYLIVSIQ